MVNDLFARRPLRHLFTGLAIALMATGCGSDADRAAPTTSTTSVAPTVEGDEFRDPQGAYTITISPTWVMLLGTFVAEVEAWSVGETVDGFTPNVNVIRQDFPGATLADYIEFSDSGAGITIDDTEVVTLAPEREAARMLMSQTSGRGTKLRSLAIGLTRQNTAVLATLTTRAADFDRLVSDVEPFLRTLRLVPQ